MKTNYIKLMALIMIFSSTISLADKPSWAGNGGKPSDYEKSKHKEEMTSKHKSKKEKDKYKKDKERYEDYENKQHRYIDDRHQNRVIDSSSEPKTTTSQHIDNRIDQTQRNWIDKAFNFFN